MWHESQEGPDAEEPNLAHRIVFHVAEKIPMPFASIFKLFWTCVAVGLQAS